MRLHILAFTVLGLLASSTSAFTESFNQPGGFFGNTGIGTPSVPVVPGWVVKNNSVPGGTTSWFSGNSSSPFPPQSGSGYAAVNFNSTTGANTISNWLITPELPLFSPHHMSFWTRTVDVPAFPDRLQVYLSTAGASTDVGSTPTSLGDFNRLLLDINPNMTVAGYPSAWTQFPINFSASGTGRIGFRYFVPNGGPLGANSDFIGIDTLFIEPFPEPSSVATIGLCGVVMMVRTRKARVR